MDREPRTGDALADDPAEEIPATDEPPSLAGPRATPRTDPLTPTGPAEQTDPAEPTTGLADLYDISRLADRLGVEHATIRVWLSRRVPWLPPPDGRLNGGGVWRASTLEGIEERRVRGRPGPKPRDVATVIDAPAGPADLHPGGPTLEG